MHMFDLALLLYIVVWTYGALVIFRESRQQPAMVRLMALLAIIIGPLAMLLYLGLRYVANAAAMGRMLPPVHRVGRLR
jgi:heme A synthase